MAMMRAVRARMLLSLSLACYLLVSGQGVVRAANPADVQWVNSVVRLGVLTSSLPPLVGAIAEAAAIDCLNGANPPSRTDCLNQSVPDAYKPVMVPLVLLAQAQRYFLPGAWAIRNFYKDSADDGTMVIDKNNVGTYTTSAGTATLIFSKYDDPGGTTYIVFGYRTSQGDRGSGALVVSDDGCLMYGPYFSASDPKTQGRLLLARC